MKVGRRMRSKESVEVSTVLVVKNRCQFCYAFFKDQEKVAAHSIQCRFRFSETFEASDGTVKFACAVCFDVFESRGEHKRHENLHKFPGGFPCSTCDKLFLNKLECVQHTKSVHKVLSDDRRDSFACNCCGAFFEQESYLRLHNETNCGTHRSWSCLECNNFTEEAYKSHMEIHHKLESDEDDAFLFPKVETTLTEGPCDASQSENDIKTPVEVHTSDPLLLAVQTATDPDESSECDPDMSENCTNAIEDYSVNEHKPEINEIDEPISSDAGTDFDENSTEGRRPKKKRKRKAAEKKFICKYCGRKYYAEVGLQRHVVVHGPDFSLLHKCDLCPIYFETTEKRAAHKFDEHKEKLTCKICDRYFRTLKTLESHNVANHRNDIKIVSANPTRNPTKRKEKLAAVKAENRHECPHCDQSYASTMDLDSHLTEHGSDGSLVHKCELCPIHFKSVAEQDEHQMTVHKDEQTCTICDKVFRRHSSAVRHIRNHGKKRNRPHFVCVKCGVLFKTKTGFDGHELSDCGRKPSFECAECGKFLSNRNTLTRHMLIHTNYRKYTCEICNQKFRDKLHLTTHTRFRHTRERPYKCSYCEKCFCDTSTLRVHTLIHTGIKRHMCYGCGEKFPTNSALHKHRKYRKDTCALAPIKPPLDHKDLN